jgi:large subunit ribosomal protein L2
MGTPLIPQRRGKGSRTYRAPPYKFKPSFDYKDKNGKVIDIVRSPMMGAPLAKVQYEDRSIGYMVAPEGIRVGDQVEGIVLPLSRIAESTPIFSIETRPNSGPKLCRTPGTFAMIVSKSSRSCIIQLPSKKEKALNPDCRATLGVPAGGGRGEKPWTKAGKKWIAMHARGKLYPRTSGGAMNAVDHPFGGGYTGLGKTKSVSRHAPPGRKVGSISPKRTGRRK